VLLVGLDGGADATVLRYLLVHPREVVSKQELLEHVWGEYDGADHNVVQVYISSLRRKLDAGVAPSLIDTVRGVGYRLRDVD
jgi:two-component system, OmpR family, response regulator NblR